MQHAHFRQIAQAAFEKVLGAVRPPEESTSIPVPDQRIDGWLTDIKAQLPDGVQVALEVDLTRNMVLCTVAAHGLKYRSRASFDGIGVLTRPAI